MQRDRVHRGQALDFLLHNWLKSIFHAALAYFFHYSQLVWLLWTKIKETLSINVANMKKLLQNWIQPIALLYVLMNEEIIFVDSDSSCSRKCIYKGIFINNILANTYVCSIFFYENHKFDHISLSSLYLRQTLWL